MRDAGRIGFDIKGSYDSEMKYEFLDVVYHNGSSYVAKKETTGNAPADNNEFWQILARGESLTNNLLATAPGTALDAAVGPGIDSRITANTNAIDQLNSDFLDASVGIEIADPMSAHDIWVRISEAQWWQITTIRKIVITDANHIILSHNGYWLGTIAINAGNVTGVLVNHWTGEAVTIRASTYQTDSISFATL